MSIQRIFIANRGEICRRIAYTAKLMGIESMCLTDKNSPPAFLSGVVDKFIRVEEESVELYLDASRMLSYALEAKSDAVHPGYGFLSENEDFAQKVLDSGLKWLGPSPEAIAKMAHKSEARTLAEKVGIPCLQGTPVPQNISKEDLEKLADKITYPVLLKAAKGGGGKGMRIVHKPVELWKEAQHAFSEAQNYFGDSSLLLERYVSESRHIEVQILGDEHGNLVSIGDRDCSIQRRYQKIIEEAPAIGISEETRKSLYENALKLAKHVQYRSCGTVEFLLDCSKASKAKKIHDFFFLEMNTRLQVEHPVTEEVYGIDLVEWQIRIANGEKLPNALKTLKAHGHCIESRIYAEDPAKNFFPSPGKVYHFSPFHAPGVRWDLGIDAIDEITTKFDPMFSKLICHGNTRELAIERMSLALEKTFVAGPVNNINFLNAILQDKDFQKGSFDTHFLKRKMTTLNESGPTTETQTLVDKLYKELTNKNSFQKEGPSQQVKDKIESIFSFAPKTKRKDSTLKTFYEYQRFVPAFDAYISNGQGSIIENIQKVNFSYATVQHNRGPKETFIKIGRFIFHKKEEKREKLKSRQNTKQQNQIQSPVPGKILDVCVKDNQSVKKQETLFILDSMKMEFVISSHSPGTILKVKVKIGDQVQTGQLLADFNIQENR